MLFKKFLTYLFIIFIFGNNIQNVSSLSLRNKNNLINQEINNLFNDMLFSPLKLLLHFSKEKLESFDDDFSCTMCLNLVDAVTKTVIEKYHFDGLYHYAKLLCSLYFNYDVCETYVDHYGLYLLDAIILRAGNKHNICQKLNFLENNKRDLLFILLDCEIMENDKLLFTLDPVTTQFSIKVKDSGKVWYSNPVDSNKDPLALTKEKMMTMISAAASAPASPAPSGMTPASRRLKMPISLLRRNLPLQC